MPAKPLTRDNTHLSQPKRVGSHAVHSCEVVFTSAHRALSDADEVGSKELPTGVSELITHSISESTRRAYRSDLAHFVAWGGILPAHPNLVASYLADYADSLSVATLVRRVAALSKAHEAQGFANPCRAETVRATLRGIKRLRGTAQQQAKPLMREDLVLVLNNLGEAKKDVRDRALLLLGFAGGFRRSELVGLDCEDIVRVRQGLVATLRSSKTDQERQGRKIGIPHGRTRHCPIAALDAWLALAGIVAGPLFRPVDRHGHVHPDRLSGEAVSLVIRERLAAVDIDPGDYSGHSLRAGFATSAAQAGVSSMKIRAQTGHTSDAMLGRYIRDGELFIGNAAGALL